MDMDDILLTSHCCMSDEEKLAFRRWCERKFPGINYYALFPQDRDGCERAARRERKTTKQSNYK